MEEENAEDWESSFFKAIENVNRQNQYIERGKLGGRPKSDAPKTERLALRFTPSEMKILQNRADEKKLKLTDYSRIILLEKQLGNFQLEWEHFVVNPYIHVDDSSNLKFSRCFASQIIETR